MGEQEEKVSESITMAEVVEEAAKYSSSQHEAFIEELRTDIQNLAHSMENLYDEHTEVFLMHGVQVEVKLSVYNELVYRQVLGCPEVYNRITEMVERLKGSCDD